VSVDLKKESAVKIVSLAALLCLLPVFAAPVRASDIKESDYPNQYEVKSTDKTSKLLVSKACSMTLVDKAKPNVAINVAKNGYGSCQTLDNGKVYKGRENTKKHELELVIEGDKKNKARIENWQIVGTIDITPGSQRPNS
jgi:ribosomal protein S24E